METRTLIRVVQVVFAKGVASSGGVLLQFVMLALLLPASVGKINTLIAFALGISLLIRGGLDIVAIREVSAWFLSGKKELIPSFFRLCVIKISSRALFVLFASVVFFLVKSFSEGWELIIFSIYLSFCFSVVLVSSSIIKGMQNIVLGGWLEQGQVFFLAAVIVLFVSIFTDIDESIVLLILVLSGSLVLIPLLIFFVCSFFGQLRSMELPSFKERGFFLLNGVAYLAQWGVILVVRAFYDLEDTGYFSTALRIGMILNFLMMIANQFLVPKMSHYYETQSYEKIEFMMKRASGILFLASCVLVTACLAFYGLAENDQIAIVNMTIIIMLGQLFNVSTGPTGYLLSMSGQETMFLKATLLGAMIGTAVMAFIGWYGGPVIWMAVGYSLVPIITSIYCLICVKQKFGFYSLPSYLGKNNGRLFL